MNTQQPNERPEPPPLYHGTRAGFRTPGGLLLPGDTVGHDHHSLARSHVVYVTTDLDLAWAYAYAARGRGKPRVLQVQPFGPLAVDHSTVNGEEQDAYTCEAATVLAVLTTPPTALARAHAARH